MTTELVYLSLAVLLVFAQIFLAASAATRARGLEWNAGPRDAVLPPLTGLAGRLERAQRNLLETFPLFLAAVVIAHLAGVHTGLTVAGAALYFWARLLYVPLYAAGVPFVRSLVWLVSIVGILLLLAAPLMR